MARPHRSNDELGHHRRRCNVVCVAVDPVIASRRAVVHDAAGAALPCHRGTALSLLRRLSRPRAADRAQLFRAAVCGRKAQRSGMGKGTQRQPDHTSLPDKPAQRHVAPAAPELPLDFLYDLAGLGAENLNTEAARRRRGPRGRSGQCRRWSTTLPSASFPDGW